MTVDGYDPRSNTIYEFHGDFWHGNPMFYEPSDLNKISNTTFGELFQKTVARTNFLRSLGYNVVEIWEWQWKYLNKMISKIRFKKERRKKFRISTDFLKVLNKG